MSDKLEELEIELARIAQLDLAEQPAAFASLREKLEAQLNSASDEASEQ
jgi:hypothetical protein